MPSTVLGIQWRTKHTVLSLAKAGEKGKNPVGFIEYIVSLYQGGGEGKERFFFEMGDDHTSLLLLVTLPLSFP